MVTPGFSRLKITGKVEEGPHYKDDKGNISLVQAAW